MTTPSAPIKLFLFEPTWGLPSSSPFCIKLDAWFRMSGLPFESVHIASPGRAPKKKAPWIQDGTVVMGDSTLIIEHLTHEYEVALDHHLSPRQRNEAVAWQALLEDHYYQVLLYTHFVTDRGWRGMVEGLAGVPSLVRPLVGAIMRREVKRALWGAGMGRHTHEEIVAFGQRDLRTLSELLGDQPYFFGEPSTFDACAYGFLTMTLLTSVQSEVREYAERELPSLHAFCQRFAARYYENAPPRDERATSLLTAADDEPRERASA